MSTNNLNPALVVEKFWGIIGIDPGYPCDLEDIILWSQPQGMRIEVIRLPMLSVSAVNEWIERAKVPYVFRGRDRRLTDGAPY